MDSTQGGSFYMFKKVNFESLQGNDNIDIRNNRYNNNKFNNRYALKRDYSPKNEITYTAYKIAAALDDLNNYAFYISAVKKITPAKALELLLDTQADIQAGLAKGRPIRNPGAVFNWKVKNHRTSYEK